MTGDRKTKLAVGIAVGCLCVMLLTFIGAMAFGAYLLSTAPREKAQTTSGQMEEQVLGVNVFITESQNRINHSLLYGFLALAGISLLAGRRAFKIMSGDSVVMNRLPQIESRVKMLGYDRPPPHGSFKFALFCILTILLGEAFIVGVFGSEVNRRVWPALIIFLFLAILVRGLIWQRISNRLPKR